jgi:uncharacterized protein (DUF2461 family)
LGREWIQGRNIGLNGIHDFIVQRPAQWKTVINDAKFRRLCALEGAVLSRPTKSYDPGHPLIDDLKRKDFIAVTNLDLADALSPRHIDRFTAACIAASPMMRFLTKALGLQFLDLSSAKIICEGWITGESRSML